MSTILLQIADKNQQQRFADSLREKFDVIAESLEQCGGDVDAVLADHSPDLRTPRSLRAADQHLALAAIGWEGPADVVLPADVTNRELSLVCSLLTEITRLRRESSNRHLERTEMRHLAYSDPLTGIPNRRAWDQQAEQQFELAVRSGTSLGLAIIDLDHFKQVNDRYGHASGDEALKSAARAISASVRASDFVARLGGDEFGLLLPELVPSAAATVMERIRRAVATQCSRPAGPNISASIGYALRTTESKFSTFFDRCDDALRQAKGNGRDRAAAG
jgi:diguanylate cyclase (GGDEF)-like protein